ncbi:MAG TPA: hypothetical protein VMK42_17995 [Anaeromyxobacteraceae bacterium]|nr:hypothetical protein [Anaeromyxobacteraceae bacterium]
MDRERTTRRKILFGLAVGLAALGLSPLRSDGGQAQCCNLAGSLASTVNSPVNGDEQFFTIPNGPANVMFLEDCSGSMMNIPQCGDASTGWASSSALPTCQWPLTSDGLNTPATPANPAVGTSNVTYSGTSNVSGNASLSWMTGFTPTSTLVDPGMGVGSNGLVDQPTWGTGCTGSACQFLPGSVYYYCNSTNSDGSQVPCPSSGVGWTETTATPASDCSFQVPYTDYICPAKTKVTRYITVNPPNCASALFGAGAPGFYFYNWSAKYTANNNKCTSTSTTSVTGGPVLALAGGWLNANPPKFMSARHTVKTTVWIDPTNPQPSDLTRFGLAYMSTAISNNAEIIVPLGPDSVNTFPTNAAKMVQARQAILDAYNHLNWPGGGLPSLASGGTPTASALFHVGQYFTNPGLYTTKFGSSYELSAFAQSTPGAMNVSWAQSNPNQCSVCWGCQTNSVIIITDGSPNSEMSFPATIKTYDNSAYYQPSNCGGTNAGGKSNSTTCSNPVNTTKDNVCCSPSDTVSNPSYLPRVAGWLNLNDVRSDISVDNPQILTTYTVSFNLPNPATNPPSLSDAEYIMSATAALGGGTWANAKSAGELQTAVNNAVNAIVSKQNTFSAPAAGSLSTIHTQASSVYITQFAPNQTPTWQGHVIEGILFDEFVAGCDSTKPPDQQPTVPCGPNQVLVNADYNGEADQNGNAICTNVFLVDLDCTQIAPSTSTGAYVKVGTNGVPANLPWDAGIVLSTPTQPGYTTAQEGKPNSRNILAAVPNGSGGYTMVPFDTKPADYSQLEPFMNLDPAWCINALSLARVCGYGAAPACPTVATFAAANTDQCAQLVIDFVRGWDVLDGNGNGCYGPLTPSNPATCQRGTSGEERDKTNDLRTPEVFWKLGDVFHSAPVVVAPPVVEPVCDTGYSDQCLTTIHSPSFYPNQTSNPAKYSACQPNSDAYEMYRYTNRNREQIVLVGANDGMLHAFDAGAPITSQAADSYCDHPYSTGTGQELWAFIPPDLLPRLKDLLFAHQYTVDGNVMVRDVWVDANTDRVKQPNEFHTVAIFGERSGGTQFTALDVTNPLSPTMLWTFPGPCSQDLQWMGESWSDFSPQPPPIGPVQLQLPGGATDPVGRNFEERWIAMLNGGYDPTMGAGRAVWMVDVWTGSILWRYTDDDFKTQFGYGSGTSMFPVPGAVALVDVGDPSKPQYDGDGYFDTAAWGDMGGNLFIARFYAPGTINPATGLVTNWYAARTFEEQRRTDNLQFAQNRSPFFYLPAAAYDPTGKALHVYLGGGNRERILQQGEGCGPDNLFGCCQGGCSVVDAKDSQSYASCGFSNHFYCKNGQMFRDPLSTTCGAAAPTCATATQNFTDNITLQFNCPGVGAVPNNTAALVSDVNGHNTENSCVFPTSSSSATCISTTGSNSIGANFGTLCPMSRFFGVLAYGEYTEKTFKDGPSAATFEQNRYTDGSFTSAGICASTGGNCTLVDTSTAQATVNSATVTCGSGITKCSATASDPGWFYAYGTTCPVATCDATGCTNETTGSQANVVFGCIDWNSFVPVGGQTGSNPCAGSVASPEVFTYAADYIEGVPSNNCGFNTYPSKVLYVAQQESTTAVPPGSIFRVDVSSSGQVGYSSLQMNPGAAPTSLTSGTRSAIAESVYWLEIPRTLHNCRHVLASGACE